MQGMGNLPELIFAISVAIAFGLIGTIIFVWVVCGVVVWVQERRRAKRRAKAAKARKEIDERQLALKRQADKRWAMQEYWDNMVRNIDKEFR